MTSLRTFPYRRRSRHWAVPDVDCIELLEERCRAFRLALMRADSEIQRDEIQKLLDRAEQQLAFAKET
jgi:hypothetical protein